LNHEDAQWRPTDFQPESSGVDTHVSPDFLQPDHRPSLPMPTVSTFWNTGHYNRPLQPTQPAINPELLHGQVEVPYPTNREYRSHGYYMTPDVLGNSSVTQNTDQPGFFNGETTPYSKSFASSMPSAATHSYCHFNEPHSHNFSTNGYTQPFPNSASIKDGLDQEPELSSPVRQAAGHPHYSFSLNEAWNRAQYDNSAACAQNGENYYNGPTASSFEGERHEPLLQFVSPEKSSSIPTPSLIGTPNMGPSPRTTLNTSPLEQSFRGESLVSELEGEKYDKEHEFIYLKDSATEPKPDLLPEAPVLAHAGPVTGPVKPSGRPTRVKGEFIHSLCGKSFATRHGVKKHHWGPKIDDRATTTGCWAKHGKPGVEWYVSPLRAIYAGIHRLTYHIIGMIIPAVLMTIPHRESQGIGHPRHHILPSESPSHRL
jgi:hypothetical protein